MDSEICMPSSYRTLTYEEVEYDGGISEKAKDILIGLAIGIGSAVAMTCVVGAVMNTWDSALLFTGVFSSAIFGTMGGFAGAGYYNQNQ